MDGGTFVTGQPMPSALLDPLLLRQLERLQWVASRQARSAMKGERRSRSRGQSVEFADYRSYVPGDDLRHLDWNLYGRLDRLYIRLYEEEREMPVLVLLDASESMNFGSPSKFQLARQVAGAVGYVALCGFDRVAVRVFPEAPGSGALQASLRKVRGRRSTQAFLEGLAAVTAGGAGDFNGALRRAALEFRQPGAAVVISDFLDPAGYEEGLAALVSRGFRVDAIQVLAQEEWNPVQFGDLKLVDSETGVPTEVTFGRHRLAAYRNSVERHVQALREHCIARGVRFFAATSDVPVEELLLKRLRGARFWD